MVDPAMNAWKWRRQTETAEWLISTEVKHLDLEFINNAFGTEDMFWAKPLSTELLTTMLSSSVTLGLYKVLPTKAEAKTSDSPSSPRTPSPSIEDWSEEKLQQVGIARFITDRITTAYLTDVYVDPDFRKEGLGTWLVACCREVVETMPALRRAFLICTEVGKPYYSKALDFWDSIDERKDGLFVMTKRWFRLDHE